MNGSVKNPRKKVKKPVNRAQRPQAQLAVEGAVRDLGRPYADGTPKLEIRIELKQANELAFPIGQRVPIKLRIGTTDFLAGLRSTPRSYFSICLDLFGSGGEQIKLGKVLSRAGYEANDPVRLIVKGDLITVHRRD